MTEKHIDIKFEEYTSLDELEEKDCELALAAIEAMRGSYAPYSHFNVGAAVRLGDGSIVKGANQENAAFTVGICAERAALYAAGSQFPDTPVEMLAIAARGTDGELTEEPVSPCGSCRQVIIETEKRGGREMRILLYGRKCVYVMDGIRQLMPLSFTEF